MREAVIVSTSRTALAKSFRGSFNDTEAPAMGGHCVKAVIEKAGIDQVKVRSALTCDTQPGICAACYGRDLAKGRSVSVGESVGVVAAQSIAEPGTQHTMRTFHIGGIAQGGSQSFLQSNHNGVIEFRNANILSNGLGEEIVTSRSMELIINNDKGVALSSHKLSYGTKLYVKEKQKISAGEKLFEWDPYTLPIIAERGGIVKFADLIPGVSVREYVDDATGISQKIVSDWRSSAKGSSLQPEIIIVDKKSGEPVKLENGNPAVHPMSVDAIMSVEDGSEIQPGDVLARIPSCLLYTSPSPRDRTRSRMPSSA